MSHQSLDVAAVIREHGHRLTPQRQMILDAVCDAHGHATPDEVYQRVQPQASAINRATVYRTLNFLCDVGLATSTVSPSGHQEYEIVGAEPHHHLVCQQCGDVQQISHSVIGTLFAQIETEYGFTVATNTHLSLFGLCARCHTEA